MSAAVALALRQNTPAWVDARRDFIGSSDVAILTGNSPYATSVFSLWAIKTRLAEPDPIDPETQELFDLGHALEPVIAERYTIITERPLRRANRMLAHPSIPWASANLDRVSAVRGERRIVELKWVPHRRWFTDGPEPVPAYVQDQVQWQLMVTGYPVADVAVLNGSRVEHHEIGPDREYQENLLYVARWFRGLVERGERPPVDGSEGTRKTLLRLHPRDTLDFAEPTVELEALAREERADAVAALAAKLEHERVRNVLRAVLGDHAGAEGDGWRVTFRKSADGASTETDWRAVAAAYRRILLDAFEKGPRSEADALVELGLPVDMAIADAMAAIESLHSQTTIKEGARPLLVRVKSEETGKWT